MKIKTTSAALIFIFFTSFTALADDPVNIRFLGDRASISGVPAGGDVALFVATWSDLLPAPTLTTNTLLLSDTDGDGMVEYLPEDGHIPAATMLLACVVDTGRYAYGRPGGGPIQVLDAASFVENDDRDNNEDMVVINARSIHVLMIRPNIGFWHAVYYDGSDNDADGEPNRSIAIDVGTLGQGGDSPSPPRDARPEDLLFVIEPYRFGIQVLELE